MKLPEHPLDRILRLYKGIEVRIINGEAGFWYKTKEKRCWSHEYYIENPVTELNTCQVCGKVSTPRKVTFRGDVWGWNIIDKKDWYTYESKAILCVGCWNKAKRIVYRKNEADQLKRQINQLIKVINNERKNQNNRPNA